MSTRVCYILPVYNEKDALPKLIDSLAKVPLPPKVSDYAIIAVDDGSTDGSTEVLETLKRSYPLFVITHRPNKGIPAVFRDAFIQAAAELQSDDIAIVLEGDGTSDVSIVPAMVQKILDGADMAIASRHIAGGSYVRFPWYRVIGSSTINLFLRMLWMMPGVTDYTMFFRAYRASLVKKYFVPGFEFKAKKSFAANGEILLLFAPEHPTVAEVPLRYDYGLKKGKSKMRLFQTLREYIRLTAQYRLTLESAKRVFAHPLTWVTLLALALRLWGIRYGFPDLLIPDEPALTRGALTMLQLHTLIPALHPAEFQAIYYPPLISYLFALVLLPVIGVGYLFSHTHSLSAYANSIVLNPTLPWLTTRLVTVVVGVVSVLVAYRITDRIKAGAGIFAALFLATSYWHVLYSHAARHWVFSLLFIAGLFWTAYNIATNGRLKWYVLSGIFAGLAFMSGVIGLLLLLLPIFAHLLRDEDTSKKFFGLNVWAMGAATLAFIVLVVCIDPHNIIPLFFSSGTNSFHEAKTIDGLLRSMWSFYRTLLVTDPLITIFGVVGLVVLLRSIWRFGVALVGVLLLIPIVIYLGYGYMPHYVLLVIPLLAAMAGIGMYQVLPRGRAGTILALCFFALPLVISLRIDVLLSRPDTRDLTRTYIKSTMATSTRIADYIPDMKLVPPSPSMLRERFMFDPASRRVADTVLLQLATSSYPRAYTVFEFGTVDPMLLAQVSKTWLIQRHFQYVIVDMFAAQDNLRALAEDGSLTSFPRLGDSAEFYEGGLGHEYDGPFTRLFAIDNFGPPIAVVQVPSR